MTPTSIQPLTGLRDIHDIAPIPWWPPAPGWWLLALALLVLAALAWRERARLGLRVPIPGITLGTWRWEAAAALRDLERRSARREEVKQTLAELSELLRRIAMARLGRHACAGLNGAAWLDWLTTHDPRGFPWRERGRLLIDAPYAPAETLPGRVSAAELQALITAVSAWVEVRDRPPRQRLHWTRWRGRAHV